jgi:DNA primase large subunit
MAAKFRSHLSRSFARAGTAFWKVVSWDERSRIGSLLTSMNSQYTGPGVGNATTYKIDGKGVRTASNCDDMATRSMPLCMRMLHRGLQRDHKLKHQGRLQYGLFLKGVGMTLKEHTLFFQKEFTCIIMSERFSKQYAYSIRHTHDKEGKRASYTPHNCVKIKMGNPPQGGAEHHGCPYRHYNDASLGALLG